MKKPIDSRLSSILRTRAAIGAAARKPGKTSPKKTIRRVERSARFKFATVKLENGGSIDCVAMNLDQFGARLRFGGEALLPANVVIVVPEVGLRRKALLRWRHGTDAGFEFIREDQDAGNVKRLRMTPSSPGAAP